MGPNRKLMHRGGIKSWSQVKYKLDGGIKAKYNHVCYLTLIQLKHHLTLDQGHTHAWTKWWRHAVKTVIHMMHCLKCKRSNLVGQQVWCKTALYGSACRTARLEEILPWSKDHLPADYRLNNNLIELQLCRLYPVLALPTSQPTTSHLTSSHLPTLAICQRCVGCSRDLTPGWLPSRARPTACLYFLSPTLC